MPKITRQQVKKKSAKKKPSASRGGILAGIKPLSEYEESPLKISVYGKAGTGKTTLWSSFPGPILAILCSGGQGTNELDSVSIEDRDKIEPYYINRCDDLLTIGKELQGDTHYSTVVIDHLTGIQDLRIAEILGLESIPVQKSWGLATREQYGERALNIKTYLRSFLDLTSHRVVLVSQEGEIEAEDTGSDLDIFPTIGPALSKSVLAWMNPASNYIVRTFLTPSTKKTTTKVGKKTITKEVKIRGKYDYCLMTGPSNIFTTKFRVPKGAAKPEFIRDPSYDRILSIVRGEDIE